MTNRLPCHEVINIILQLFDFSTVPHRSESNIARELTIRQEGKNSLQHSSEQLTASAVVPGQTFIV